MAEKYTSTPSEEAQTRMAAQRIFERPLAPVTPIKEPAPALDSTPDSALNRKPSARVQRNRAIAGGLVAAGSAAVLVGGIGNAVATPKFSENTTTYTVESGDGLYNVAEEINGISSVDIRDAIDHIAGDPANIDVLKDGLQTGEQIVIPVSVEGHENDN